MMNTFIFIMLLLAPSKLLLHRGTQTASGVMVNPYSYRVQNVCHHIERCITVLTVGGGSAIYI